MHVVHTNVVRREAGGANDMHEGSLAKGWSASARGAAILTLTTGLLSLFILYFKYRVSTTSLLHLTSPHFLT